MPRLTRTQSIQAALVGRKVLAGLEKGRARAIAAAKAQAELNQALILPLLVADIEAGRPMRGRAGRLARRLGGRLAERTVRRFLARLSSVSDSIRYDARTTHGGFHEQSTRTAPGP